MVACSWTTGTCRRAATSASSSSIRASSAGRPMGLLDRSGRPEEGARLERKHGELHAEGHRLEERRGLANDGNAREEDHRKEIAGREDATKPERRLDAVGADELVLSGN